MSLPTRSSVAAQAAIAPGVPIAAINLPRSAMSPNPSSSENTPAAQAAAYSPML